MKYQNSTMKKSSAMRTHLSALLFVTPLPLLLLPKWFTEADVVVGWAIDSRGAVDGFHPRSGASLGFNLLVLLLSFFLDKSMSDVAAE